MSKKFVDYYFLVFDILEEVRERIIFLFKKFGYRLIEFLIFEDYEKLKSLNGSNIIKFMDSDGIVVVLRNEFILKVVEIVVKF